MTKTQTPVVGVILDWAGTVVDFGCMAPAQTFIEAFAGFGVTITQLQARGPMGMAKRDHIKSILSLPEIAEAWTAKHGAPWAETDVDAIYAAFTPRQAEVVAQYADPIPGALDTVAWLRGRGIKIGSTTGYPREVMDQLAPVAKVKGYAPDAMACAGETRLGRPYPFLIYKQMMDLELSPAWACVKVDDTGVGVAAGRNAGLWSVGVAATGNGVGVNHAEWLALTQAERDTLRGKAAEPLRDAGAHFIIDGLGDLPRVIEEIEGRLAKGERP
ncbi:MAG: phosphonoacetaldehyde hydrolase [Rhodospirillum sp.]|nr:phosphonoacetaldehyde hydrolase [Rhodospirillum sp.]MCF8488701.1 phosphonoacetaldehyde hydrolase [Rhodospirillum sp.]